eukprot:scaffold160928_cov29-Attheya_sp.AAC.1
MFTDGGLLVCKKGTHIGTLHQLINKSSDKTSWWNGCLRINDHVLKIESTVRCRLAKNVPKEIPSIAKVTVNLDQSTHCGPCCHRKHGSRWRKNCEKNLAKSIIHVEAQAVGTSTCIDVIKFIDQKNINMSFAAHIESWTNAVKPISNCSNTVIAKDEFRDFYLGVTNVCHHQ